jgi:penicillin-binding protein 1A
VSRAEAKQLKKVIITNMPSDSPSKSLPRNPSGARRPFRIRRRPFIFRMGGLLLISFALLFGAAGGFVCWSISNLPAIRTLEKYPSVESSLVYSSDGRLLAEFYTERRTFIPTYMIPAYVKKALISVEDERFYEHPGVDLIGIMRALYHDIKTRSMTQGGSTITQQLAKMLFLKPEKSIKRKLKEIALSVQIEKYYTKDEIIGIYLNQAYFGTRAYGIEAASQTYFGKSASQLTIGESALLASLPKAPSAYTPFRYPERARERRSLVLRQMLHHKFITEAQFSEAEREPLPRFPHYRKYEAPHFIELLRQEFEAMYGDDLYTSGYRIVTTIDSSMQKAAEEAVGDGIASVEKRTRKGVQAALIAMDLRTGGIMALVGGSDFWKNQFNRATQALRQPGSAFKPFVYVAALESGLTSNDMIPDSPISFKGARPGQLWAPKNYDGEFHGMVTLKTALAKSLNVATVRLAYKVGVDEIIETAKRLGIRSRLQPYLPIALGASDVTLIEMVPAYGTFSTGQYVRPVLYKKVMNKEGLVLKESKAQVTEQLSPEVVDDMKVLLRAVVEQGTAQKAKELKRTIYGKTGTTNDFTDAWFIGFDYRIVVGVWVGRDDHRPIGNKETGARAALPIWMDFMKRVPRQTLGDGNP